MIAALLTSTSSFPNASSTIATACVTLCGSVISSSSPMTFNPFPAARGGSVRDAVPVDFSVPARASAERDPKPIRWPSTDAPVLRHVALRVDSYRLARLSHRAALPPGRERLRAAVQVDGLSNLRCPKRIRTFSGSGNHALERIIPVVGSD